MSPSNNSSNVTPAMPGRTRLLSTVLAWRNLMQNRKRTLTALGGISFAVLLVFMQLGFLLAAERGSTLLYEDFDFDIALLSERYQSVSKLGDFPRGRLAQVASVPGVAAVAPLRVRNTKWMNLETEDDSSVMVLGLPADPSWVRNPGLRDGVAQLQRNDQLLADSLSHDDMGEMVVGAPAQIGGNSFQIAGLFEQGMSMFSEGAAAVSAIGFEHIFRGGTSKVSIGFVRVAPDADTAVVVQALRDSLPPDVVVFSRTALIKQEQAYFVEVKPVGIVFQVGVFVAVAVGVVILFQVLSTEVSNRLREYATMKALGFGNGFIYRIGIVQALIFAVMGFIPALVLSAGVYWVVRVLSRLPMQLTPGLIAFVFGLSLFMCVVSCVLALGKVRRADPADLF